MTTNRFKYRRGTGYKVSFPTAPSLRVQPSRIDLFQAQFSHDVLELEFERTSSQWFETLKTGTPVVLNWNQNGIYQNWVGYVSHVSKESSPQKRRDMKVVCIGASYILKARASRVFRNQSVVDAARKIAKEFGFQIVTNVSPRKFPQLAMSGETYWEWLDKQAKRVGLTFTVQNTTMYIQSLDKLVARSSYNAPIMTTVAPGNRAYNSIFDRTLDRFTVLNGEHLEKGEARHTKQVTSGVNPLTSKPLSSTGNPGSSGKNYRTESKQPLFTDYSVEVVHSKRDATLAAKGLAEKVRLPIPAEILGQGDPRLRPFGTVFVEGTGTSTDGLWVVKEVQHTMVIAGDYQVHMTVVTDGLGKSVATPFRNNSGSRVGTVNLNEAVSSGSGNQAARPSRLVGKTPQFAETQQGFTELGTVWSGR